MTENKERVSSCQPEAADAVARQAAHCQPTETGKTKRIRRLKCDECGQNYVEKRGDICEGCDAYREHTGGI